jgi:hypothetical protein
MTTPKRGRKPLPPADRKLSVCMYLTADELAKVTAIGGGNRQEGMRRLLAAWKEK